MVGFLSLRKCEKEDYFDLLQPIKLYDGNVSLGLDIEVIGHPGVSIASNRACPLLCKGSIKEKLFDQTEIQK